MISMRNLKDLSTAATYYDQDDYYTIGKSPSQWLGKTADFLGLSGEVDRDQYREVLEGKLPNGDVIMGRDGRRILAFDFTFSAPKSVSLMALVSGDKKIVKAHEAAVAQAIDWFETFSAEARITKKGITTTEPTGNLLVARFFHDTSRELDPQLHSHCVTVNVTRRKDGKYRAVDNRKLYRDSRIAGAVYRAELASGLMKLGYHIEQTHPDGRFEIQGVTREQIEHFSQRRQQIEQILNERGHFSSSASERATLDSRRAKKSVERKALKSIWKERAQDVGVNLASIRRRARRNKGKIKMEPERARQAVEWAVEHLSERQSVFTEEQLNRGAFERGVGRLDRASLEGAVLAQETVSSPLRLIRTGDREYTTSRALELEREIIHRAEKGRGRHKAVYEDRVLQACLGDLGLNRDQSQAIRTLLTSKDGVTGVQGYAGTGKTTMLRTLNALAKAAGTEIIGMSNTATAANLLEKDSGIPSSTLAQHLIRFNRDSEPELSSKPVFWVVDESSMMSNRDAAKLLRLAERNFARVILVGDKAQLPAIEAGKPFGLLQKKGAMEVAVLKTIVRQKDGPLKEAIEDTIRRADRLALKKLSDQIVEIKELTPRLRAVAKDYLDTYLRTGKKPMAITGMHRDRVSLNILIRKGLSDMGELQGKTVHTEVLVSRSFTRAELADHRSYQAGDVLRFGQKNSHLDVEKGSYARVTRVSGESRRVHIETERGWQTSFSPRVFSRLEVYGVQPRELRKGDLIRWTKNDYDRNRRNGEMARVTRVFPGGSRALVDSGDGPKVLKLKESRHWDHGYASTIHAAQGQSPHEVIVHMDTAKSRVAGRESWYVAITRGKQALRVYTDDTDRLPESIKRTMAQRSALEAVEQQHFRPEPAPERDRDMGQDFGKSTGREHSFVMELTL